LLDRRPLCGGIRTEAWVGTFGPVPGIRPEQVADARLIVVWGNNVTWSNLHLMPWINRARKAGARLVVVDPRRTVIARRADLHLPLRPGTDVVLAWAVAAELERPDLFSEGTRTLNIIDVGRHLLDASLVPPIKAVFIYNHNPVVVHPDANRLQRGLAREDLFVVGADVVMTDSMTYADVVLPAASHFEHAD